LSKTVPAVMTSYGMLNPVKVREIVVSFLQTESKSLFCAPSSMTFLRGFCNYSHFAGVTETPRPVIFGFEHERSPFPIGEERPELNQLLRLAVEYCSGIRTKTSTKWSSFYFICTPETTAVDSLDHLIPVRKVCRDRIVWKTER
jgi:hypothetical protein